jgi:SpoVK/Ycf46/Vps4 family AAA+-type ATPase
MVPFLWEIPHLKADTLKRVIRAIADASQHDLERLAAKIVHDERRTGHEKLANQLESILRLQKPRKIDYLATPRTAGENRMRDLPVSRRHGESLATFELPENLEHHMVLPSVTEERFARIECEYAARDRLRAHGLKPRKTILLYGPPGCGKSLGAKRLAWGIGLPLLRVKFDVLLSSYFGESATNLRSVFIAAKELPCVLLLDECDFIARSRVDTKDIGEAARIVNALLQLMEDYDAPGLLVATTNIESSLDFAMFRRFDDVFLVPLPGTKEIEQLLRWTFSAMRLSESIDWPEIIEALTGESAAQVVKVAREAAKAAVLKGEDVVSAAHIRKAVDELRTDPKEMRSE